MTPKEQNAIFVYELKKPVQKGKREVPTPKQHEVLVKVTATMLLPHDAYGREKGLFIAEKLPFVIGTNIAGTIEGVGSAVNSHFHPGDKVFGMGDYTAPTPDQAGLQQYAVLNDDAIAKIPQGFTDEQVVSLPINAVTSFLAMFTKSGFDFPRPWEQKSFDLSNETLVIIGGGSSAAKIAVQYGKLVNVGRMVVIAGPANKDELMALGATNFIDRHASPESLRKQLFAIIGPEGATKVYDCYSWTQELGTSFLANDQPSTLVALHRFDPSTIQKTKPLATGKPIACTQAALRPYTSMFWSELPKWVQSGMIKPTPSEVIGNLDNVDEINTLLDEYAVGKTRVQGIVRP